jgi:ubiquinone/menaquinone biosynthesis C-methylase UbiE
MPKASDYKFSDARMAAAYEQHFVPRLFEPWARWTLEQLALKPGETLVDVATGPGTVARLAAIKLGQKGKVIGADASPAMLLLANQRTGVPGIAPIDYLQCGAEALKVPDAVADVLTCQQGIQFFPDRTASLREMARVTKPGARVAISAWAGLERNPFFAAAHAVAREVLPESVADLLAVPFSLGSGDELREAVQRAGFKEVRLEAQALPLVFEDGVDQAVAALGGTALAPSLTELSEAQREKLRASAKKHFTPLLKDSAIQAAMESNVVFARR